MQCLFLTFNRRYHCLEFFVGLVSVYVTLGITQNNIQFTFQFNSNVWAQDFLYVKRYTAMYLKSLLRYMNTLQKWNL